MLPALVLEAVAMTERDAAAKGDTPEDPVYVAGLLEAYLCVKRRFGLVDTERARRCRLGVATLDADRLPVDVYEWRGERFYVSPYATGSKEREAALRLTRLVEAGVEAGTSRQEILATAQRVSGLTVRAAAPRELPPGVVAGPAKAGGSGEGDA